jgi:hypothetical protein
LVPGANENAAPEYSKIGKWKANGIILLNPPLVFGLEIVTRIIDATLIAAPPRN